MKPVETYQVHMPVDEGLGENYRIMLNEQQALELIGKLADKLAHRRRDGEGQLKDGRVYIELHMTTFPHYGMESLWD